MLKLSGMLVVLGSQWQTPQLRDNERSIVRTPCKNETVKTAAANPFLQLGCNTRRRQALFIPVVFLGLSRGNRAHQDTRPVILACFFAAA